jgi:uroporphyrinogen-III synthase
MVASAARVLVTRPRGQEATLGDALRAAGHEVFHQPLLELEPLAELPPDARRCVMDLDLYQHVIFISGNAVRFGMEWIENYWPQLPVGITWYAVGAKTAAALSECGIRALSPGADMSSEGLLALPDLQSIAGQRVLIVKGEGGREALQEALQSRGAKVDTLPCYRRRCPRLAEGELARRLKGWHIDTILISSGEGLGNLLALLSTEETTNFTGVRLLVPSARVEGMARQAGFSRVVIAANASDDAMLAALEESMDVAGEQ